MTFLNSALLAALSLGLIPILIHLLTRQRFKQVDFPTLRFLREIQKQKMRRVRVRQWILLILRTLAVLFLVLALARPVLRSSAGAFAAGDARSSVVLILDRSASMSAESPSGTRFHEMQIRAQEILNSLGSSDDVQIVWADEPPQTFPETPTTHRALIRETIESEVCGEKSGDLVQAIGLARSILGQTQNLHKEVYVISDFSQSAWPERMPEQPLLPDDVRLYLAQIGNESVKNIGLTDAQITSRLIAPGRSVELNFTATNSGDDEAADRVVGVYLDGRRVAQSRLSLRPGEAATSSVRFVPDSPGVLTGYARLEDADGYAADDLRRFVLRVPSRLRVAVVGNSGAARSLTALALNPSADPQSFVLATELEAGEFDAADWSQFDAVMIVDAGPFSSAFSERMRAFVEQGRGVFIIPGPQFDARAHNSWLQALGLPSISQESNEIGTRRWSTVDIEHPLFEGVFEGKPEDFSPEFTRTVQVTAGSGSSVAIISGAGQTYLYEARLGNGRALLFASSPDPSWSSLFRSGIFSPLMVSSAAYLAGSGISANDHSLQAGRAKELVLRTGGDRTFQLAGENLQLALSALPVSGGLKLPIPALDHTGDFSLKQGEHEITRLVVNSPARESAIRPLEQDSYAELLGGSRMVLKSGADVDAAIREGRYGRELWKLCLIAALLLLVAEMLIARTGRREAVLPQAA